MPAWNPNPWAQTRTANSAWFACALLERTPIRSGSARHAAWRSSRTNRSSSGFLAERALAENREMNWELAHRPRDTSEPTTITLEAPDSWSAVEKLRAAIPANHLVLYVRAEI